MAATRTGSTPSANGSAAQAAGAKAKEVGGAAASAARDARGPLIAAGAAAAGLAGGLAIGARRSSKRSGLGAFLSPRRTVLGVPLGRKSGLLRAAEALGDGARHLSAATGRVSDTTDDLHQIREQLELVNRRSPLEVVLDGLTHRRGAHKNEG
jgi:hypothetical protein